MHLARRPAGEFQEHVRVLHELREHKIAGACCVVMRTVL